MRKGRRMHDRAFPRSSGCSGFKAGTGPRPSCRPVSRRGRYTTRIGRSTPSARRAWINIWTCVLASRPWWSRRLPTDALSDLIRVTLLQRYGGVWADSTVYCLQPLEAWLPVNFGSGFFAFAKPGPDRMLSSWFLAAAKGNYLVEQWRRRAAEYWSRRRKRHHDFWFHYLFAEAYEGDRQFRAAWDATPEVSADGPHYYSPYEKLGAAFSSSDLLLLDTPQTPVLKLTHKLPEGQYTGDTVLCHLCARADAAWRRARAAAGDNRLSLPRDLPRAG